MESKPASLVEDVVEAIACLEKIKIIVIL